MNQEKLQEEPETEEIAEIRPAGEEPKVQTIPTGPQGLQTFSQTIPTKPPTRDSDGELYIQSISAYVDPKSQSSFLEKTEALNYLIMAEPHEFSPPGTGGMIGVGDEEISEYPDKHEEQEMNFSPSSSLENNASIINDPLLTSTQQNAYETTTSYLLHKEPACEYLENQVFPALLPALEYMLAEYKNARTLSECSIEKEEAPLKDPLLVLSELLCKSSSSFDSTQTEHSWAPSSFFASSSRRATGSTIAKQGSFSMESPADMTIYPDLENVKVEPEDGKEKELKYDSNIGSILEMNGNKGGAQEVGI